MKTYVVFSSREPLLIVIQRSIRDRSVLGHLDRIGCSKFIAREVPVEQVRRRYGRRFEVVERALRDGVGFRVLDYNGENIFHTVPLSDLGRAYRCESVSAAI
jgi:hypothetical protein